MVHVIMTHEGDENVVDAALVFGYEPLGNNNNTKRDSKRRRKRAGEKGQK